MNTTLIQWLASRELRVVFKLTLCFLGSQWFNTNAAIEPPVKLKSTGEFNAQKTDSNTIRSLRKSNNSQAPSSIETYIAEGRSFASQLLHAKASAAYLAASKIAEQLIVAGIDTQTNQNQLAISLRLYAGALEMEGEDIAGALLQAEQSARISAALYETSPTSSDWRHQYAVGLLELACMLTRQEQVEKAEPFFELGLTHAVANFEESPDDFEIALNLAHYWQAISDLHVRQKKLKQAVGEAEKSLQIFEILVTENSTNRALQSELVNSLAVLGDLWSRLGNQTQASSLYQRSLAITERLAADQLNSESYQLTISQLQARVGVNLFIQGQLNQALSILQKNLKLNEQFSSLRPYSQVWQKLLNTNLSVLADVLTKQTKWSEAQKLIRKNITSTEKHLKKNPGDLHWRKHLVNLKRKLGELLILQDQHEAGLQTFELALLHSKNLFVSNQVNTEVIQLHILSLSSLLNYWLGRPQDKLSVKSIDRYIDKLQDLIGHMPPYTLERIETQLLLYEIYSRVGETMLRRGDVGQASWQFKKCIEITNQLSSKYPDNENWLWSRADSLYQLARTYHLRNQKQFALDTYHQSRETAEYLLQRNLGNFQLINLNIDIYEALAIVETSSAQQISWIDKALVLLLEIDTKGTLNEVLKKDYHYLVQKRRMISLKTDTTAQ